MPEERYEDLRRIWLSEAPASPLNIVIRKRVTFGARAGAALPHSFGSAESLVAPLEDRYTDERGELSMKRQGFSSSAQVQRDGNEIFAGGWTLLDCMM